MASLVGFWNASAVVPALTYADKLTAVALQGLSNRNGPAIFFDIGADNYDWPHADAFWHETLTADGRVHFETVGPSLCSLVERSKEYFEGLIVWRDAEGSDSFGDGYSAAIALTIAGQTSALPVSEATLAKHDCLAAFQVKTNVTELLRGMTRIQAWDWAVKELLPAASRTVVFNLNRYRVVEDPQPFRNDKQSPATASSLDYALQQRAFVVDLESHAAVGNSTAPWGADDKLLEQILSSLAPLFDAYGWSDDEFSWTNITSHHGGTIMCSFASPNLSFWARLRLPHNQTTPRPLPASDRGMALDRSKYYVTFETNEGDTPRILVSAMASSWTASERGTIPIAWAIDPLLAERFPALFDYFAATATRHASGPRGMLEALFAAAAAFATRSFVGCRCCIRCRCRIRCWRCRRYCGRVCDRCWLHWCWCHSCCCYSCPLILAF